MRIKLNRLIIINFKGIIDFELNIGGENASVIGENGTGKTSIADAFYWLVTDQNLERKSKFGIIHNGADQAEVEAELFLGSKLIRPKKVYRPVIKNEVVTGYTTDHFIDGAYATQKEFQAEFDFLKDVRLINDISYLMSLPVNKRREFIFKLKDDVEPDDIIKEYPNLKPVKKILNGRDLLRCKKNIEDDVKLLDKQNKEIPIEIKTLYGLMPATKPVSEKKIRDQIDVLNEKIANIKTSGEHIKRVALLESEMMVLEADTKKKYQAEWDKLLDKKLAFKKLLSESNFNISELERSIKTNQSSLIEFNSQIESLKKRWLEEKRTIYEPSTICYACKQPLPEDQITRQIDEFKKERAKSIKQIDLEGKNLRTAINDLEKNIPLKIDKMEKLKFESVGYEDEINKIDAEIIDHEKNMVLEIEEKRSKINEQIRHLRQLDEQEETYGLEKERSKLEMELINIVNAEKAKISIERLEVKSKEIAIKKEKLEKDIWLLEEFNRKKAEFIEQVIDDNFQITEWKLFEVFNNGNLKEICEPYYDGIPYLDLNTGAKVNLGLDICNTFSNHLNIKFPIFIDNSESITSWLPIDNQIIKLRAIEGEKELKVNDN